MVLWFRNYLITYICTYIMLRMHLCLLHNNCSYQHTLITAIKKKKIIFIKFGFISPDPVVIVALSVTACLVIFNLFTTIMATVRTNTNVTHIQSV